MDKPIFSERIFRQEAAKVLPGMGPGVSMIPFTSNACGAMGFSTGLAIFEPGSMLPYHTHPCSEAVTVLKGSARVQIEGRTYRLEPKECAHFPAGVAHRVTNPDPERELIAHTAFGSATPTRNLITMAYSLEERDLGDPLAGEPENIRRFRMGEVYQLQENAFFTDLFARRFGASGICGGYARFLPGASLPCHTHDYDESITIVAGSAMCLVEGRKYQLRPYETAFIPMGIPHRFLNHSNEEMVMLWVYAGDEPDRTIVDSGYCDGTMLWQDSLKDSSATRLS